MHTAEQLDLSDKHLSPTLRASRAKKPKLPPTPLLLRRRALSAVRLAIKSGELPSLIDGATACADCGTPANCYDHRNYNHPLAVDPVCTGCNIRRGPGFPLNPDGNEYTSWVARKLGPKAAGQRWDGLAGGTPETRANHDFKAGSEKSVGDFIDEHWITYEQDPDCAKMIQEARLARGKRCHYGYQKSFIRGLFDWYGIEPI